MSARHTPGPWSIVDATVEEDGSIFPRHIVGGSRELVVMYANESRNSDGTLVSDDMAEAVGDVRSKTANLHLIAAAPDMLAALKALLLPDGEPGIGEWWGLPEDEQHERIRAAIAKAEGW